METLIAVTTSATQSTQFVVNEDRPTFAAVGTYAAGEDAVLEIWNGTAWAEVIIDGTTQVLDEQNTVMTIYGRGIYRFNKDATVAAAGVIVTGV